MQMNMCRKRCTAQPERGIINLFIPRGKIVQQEKPPTIAQQPTDQAAHEPATSQPDSTRSHKNHVDHKTCDPTTLNSAAK